MGSSSGKIEIDKMGLEAVQKFYEWLQGGDSPDGISFKVNPKLTAEEAFSVIYYLQEELEILPDHYEQCKECKCLYDSHTEGTSIYEESTIINDEGNEVDGNFPEKTFGMYCDDCRPD